jgi:hypothetical protein
VKYKMAHFGKSDRIKLKGKSEAQTKQTKRRKKRLRKDRKSTERKSVKQRDDDKTVKFKSTLIHCVLDARCRLFVSVGSSRLMNSSRLRSNACESHESVDQTLSRTIISRHVST